MLFNDSAVCAHVTSRLNHQVFAIKHRSVFPVSLILLADGLVFIQYASKGRMRDGCHDEIMASFICLVDEVAEIVIAIRGQQANTAHTGLIYSIVHAD